MVKKDKSKRRIRLVDNLSYAKCKSDKNWENWERIREQKLEKMKSICLENYRARRERMKPPPKPQSLDPSWYTDNIYNNQSIDLDEGYIPECLKYTTYRKLRDITELDEDYDPDGYVLQRSRSCKEFKYPKSKSCCFGGYELKPKPAVPKSYSFSVNRVKTKPFDVIDYEPPSSRRDRKLMRKSMDYFCHDTHSRCCARDRCTSSKCLLEEIYNYNRKANRERERERRSLGHGRRGIITDWEERNRYRSAYGPTCEDYHCRRPGFKKRHCHGMECHDEDRCEGFEPIPHCSEDHFHSCDPYETDVNHFINDERSRLMMQDKFLDEDEIYLRSEYQPVRNKSMLEVQPPSKYDEDTESDSTEMDLEDFNFDFEKYWEELDKPPSPIDLDMQRRNMNKNFKVKNVNVGCYNNGTPIDEHHKEQERMLIKKSLLEGMPSPPNNATDSGSEYPYFEQSCSPFHRYTHKVYPEPTPVYKYNNFYPHEHLHPPQNTSNNPLSLINNIFSIYKPNKYSPLNCQQINDHKPEPCKKMNVPSTIRPLGAPHSDYVTSMKRPLIVSTEQPHFKIIPEKTGLKISPFYNYDYVDKKKHKLKSTARPLLFPH